MAVSIRKRLRAAALLACLGACASGVAAPAPVSAQSAPARAPVGLPQFNSNQPIALEAQSTEFDYRNGTLMFRKVKITQGDMSVEADQAQANGLNFDNSQWNFRGKVHMNMEQGTLISDDAQITFADKALAKALINGNPAQFEQRSTKTGQLARGHARTIEYDVKQGVVKLSKDAWLTDGQNEIHGEALRYSVRDQKVVADAAEQNSQRVRIIITPPNKTKP